jgi:tetrahydromethanopterin S-methyltransferase subunit G
MNGHIPPYEEQSVYERLDEIEKKIDDLLRSTATVCVEILHLSLNVNG